LSAKDVYKCASHTRVKRTNQRTDIEGANADFSIQHHQWPYCSMP